MPSKPSDKVEDIRSDPFPDVTDLGDPALRLVAWLLRNKDFRQLEQRTGVPAPRKLHAAPSGRRTVPVVFNIDLQRFSVQQFSKYDVPKAYGNSSTRSQALKHATGSLPLDSIGDLVDAIRDLRGRGVTRLSLGAPGQPSRDGPDFVRRPSLEDLGLPKNRSYKGNQLTGEGVIVGIIDDGCALAHCNFLKPRAKGAAAQSRVLYLWDQAGNGDPTAGWTPPPDFYGLEIKDTAINAVLNANQTGDLIAEDAVYKRLGYEIGEVATHGTHVMDTAVGNGQALMGIEGVAPGADIIFVQLPREAIEHPTEDGTPVLWKNIVDGVQYIFARAKALKKSAVVNISYGGYDGPHDGTSELERTLDEMLAEPNFAVVLAAGNGFEARCHSKKTVQRNGTESVRWILNPEDPTANDLEIWYDDDKSELLVRLISPGLDNIDPAGWIQLGQARTPITNATSGKTIGYIEQLPSKTGNSANRIAITLNATDSEANAELVAQAPSGMWTIELKHRSGSDVDCHAWIWRDDAGSPRHARRMQSRFHPDDADPAYTIAGWATGQLTISVGGYNAVTQEVCRYSACGPTRPIGNKPGRKKPEVYAPAEEDVRGRGVLSASALSANPSRMNGTSAAAPSVSGLIALMFEYANKYSNKTLTADKIRKEVKAASDPSKLKLNGHQKVDKRVKKKQESVKVELLDSGKANFTKTMDNL